MKKSYEVNGSLPDSVDVGSKWKAERGKPRYGRMEFTKVSFSSNGTMVGAAL